MGWTWLNDADGDTYVPALTERDSFRQVLLVDRLRAALRRINTDEVGRPWLDDQRITQAVSELDRPGTVNLFETNERVYHLLTRGVTVAGDPLRHGDRDVTVQYIDFENPQNNDLLIINQFRVDPPWATDGKGHSIPDIVLFVNGIPLVVIECKDTDATDPLHEGIHQLLRYSNQHDTEQPEGVERLFWYNQIMVATYWYKAVAGTLGAAPKHYKAWRDTAPLDEAQVAIALSVDQLTEQQRLVAGMLQPEHLLDLIRNFILFEDDGGQRIKIVARYQQFRAAHKALHRLLHNPTRLEDGEHDRRGGIIWHTQGSGKSLTMVFLVRKLRTLPDLRRFKVVVVTDRVDLEEQLRETAALVGEPVRPNQYDQRPHESATAQLQRILAEEGPDLVFAMIQKYQQREEDGGLPRRSSRAELSAETYAALPLAAERQPDYLTQKNKGLTRVQPQPDLFPVLNTSEHILVLVDEAHRSHANNLHANLMRALPNCAQIGFTGTPIIIGEQKRTHEIFGPFIDKYTIRQSEADGMTVPIRYEGYTTDAKVYAGGGLDQLFENMFRERTPEEMEEIKAKYATRGNVLEAKSMIQAKARHMLRHYVQVVLPEGFKAQVVAVSRRAAVRYQRYLAAAQSELLAQLDALPPALTTLTPEEMLQQDAETQFLVAAYRQRNAIRRLRFAAVISAAVSNDPARRDPAEWRRWSDHTHIEQHIADFKKPLYHADPARSSGLAFLCVKSMLLTGFDAPVEQVLYLDRGMRGHELLQAIARVNRTAPNKEQGIVVDYYGVSTHLKEALDVYTDADIEGVMTSIKDELPKLADRHQRVLDLLAHHGIADIYAGMDECIFVLENMRLRSEFTVKLHHFLITLNNVMPRPEALPYLRDARMLGIIAKSAANLYRDPQLDVRGVGHKVQTLIDEHIRAHGIEPTIPPISILDSAYESYVAAQSSDRAKALEMEHALRRHISQRYREDPVFYRKLSERLEAILRQVDENWAAQTKALQDLIRAVRQGEATADDPRFDRHTPAAFFRLLVEAARDGADLPASQLDRLVNVTFEMMTHIRQEVQRVDFWRNGVAQHQLRAWLVRYLDDKELLADLGRIEELADQIMEMAHAHHVKLTG